MQSWKLTLAVITVSSAFVGQAWALTFSGLNAGTNITINDTIWNSTYNGGSPARNVGNEDNETERTNSGQNTYTGQKWDFEGMFWNGSSKTLTLVAGWDFVNGVTHSPKIQVGDFFMGSWGTPDYTHGKKFIANEALDFSRDSDGSLQASGTYDKITGSFSTNSTSDVTPLSDPYTYKTGGRVTSSNSFKYTTGLIINDGSMPFLGWNDSDVSGKPFNNNHYFMQIVGLNESELIGDILHITLACGNDVGRGELTSVPEPSTFLLLGAGLWGMGLVRRKVRK